nr:tRNA pseudouridine(38-40) synthase TruA [Hyphomonas sediminis]
MPSDLGAIAALNDAAFGGPDEGRIVRQLWADGDSLLSIVAEEGGELAGHIEFFRILVDGAAVAAGLGPMCVHPGRQRCGIGGALIGEGLRILEASGESVIFVLGHDAYYPKFGFAEAAAKPFSAPWSGPHFMARVLSDAAPAQGGADLSGCIRRLRPVDPSLRLWHPASMPRYRLLIEYHGGPYQGWMKLPGKPTVQAALEEAAAKLDGGPVEIYGAGRTDAGVHATGQVAHMDLRQDRPNKVADAMNFHLRPHPIAVLKAERVDDDFHARFSATARHYRYVVINRRADLAIERGIAWRVPSKLDADKMQEAAQALVGTHDFSTFRDTECQAATPVKSLWRFDVARYGDRIEFTCSAPSFIHRQVRSMVGSLVEVGRGREPVRWMKEILDATDRQRCGPVAPSDGLFLERVDYDQAT